MSKYILLTFIAFGLSLTSALSQSLYVQTFGEANQPALIFLHGGPGYNSANFEGTTAKTLADAGFFVVLYDRRGEGRSADIEASYTFEQSITDLKAIYSQFNLKQATLLGHSFGGMLAIKFTEAHPEKVKSLVLIGAPLSLQASFKHIIKKSKAIYEAKSDAANLKYIGMLEVIDTTTIAYSSYCFSHAMQNGFYSPKIPTPQAVSLYTKLKNDSALAKAAGSMGYQAPQGFWKNESYTTLDLRANLKALKDKGQAIYGFYGQEDSLYSETQINELKSIIGAENMRYLDNCSHNVFIDQQAEFIKQLKMWL
jgi:proline iminopeptidase